jgi:hypothetical protein
MSTTISDGIAEEFSRDKAHLTPAEQRRLAGMIDRVVGTFENAIKRIREECGAAIEVDTHEFGRFDAVNSYDIEVILDEVASSPALAPLAAVVLPAWGTEGQRGSGK